MKTKGITLKQHMSITIRRIELVKKQRETENKRVQLNRCLRSIRSELSGLDTMLINEYDAK